MSKPLTRQHERYEAEIKRADKRKIKELRAEIERKDKLIEQMREALELSESQAARARFFAYKTALELSESKLIDARARVTRLERIVNDS